VFLGEGRFFWIELGELPFCITFVKLILTKSNFPKIFNRRIQLVNATTACNGIQKVAPKNPPPVSEGDR
jgi:hypothetical protein